jgi:hypothetical protein
MKNLLRLYQSAARYRKLELLQKITSVDGFVFGVL